MVSNLFHFLSEICDIISKNRILFRNVYLYAWRICNQHVHAYVGAYARGRISYPEFLPEIPVRTGQVLYTTLQTRRRQSTS